MNVRRLAELAIESYDNPTHSDGSSNSLVYKKGRATCILFTGTQPLEDPLDIITDIRVMPWYAREIGAWCHAGFLKSLRKLYDELDPIASSADVLYIGGHSLGGAMAAIYAARHNPRALVRWGCPRPGMQSLADITSQIPGYLFEREGDIVTDVPLKVPPIWPYVHDREPYKMKGPIASIKAGFKYRLKAHSMEEYCRYMPDIEM